jgi:hypothetical protein
MNIPMPANPASAAAETRSTNENRGGWPTGAPDSV